MPYNVQGLLSVFEFEKQMIMIPTKDDLVYEVCTALGRSEDDAVLSLADKLLLMFERLQKLQQTPCTTQLPDDYCEWCKGVCKRKNVTIYDED